MQKNDTVQHACAVSSVLSISMEVVYVQKNISCVRLVCREYTEIVQAETVQADVIVNVVSSHADVTPYVPNTALSPTEFVIVVIH